MSIIHIAIIEFEGFVHLGNTILQDYYNLSNPPLIAKNKKEIPKQGQIMHNNQTMWFNFHGFGCSFKFDDIHVEFDYAFGEFSYKGFEINKLYQFILTNHKFSGSISYESYQIELLALETLGIIERKSFLDANTYDYILKK